MKLCSYCTNLDLARKRNSPPSAEQDYNLGERSQLFSRADAGCPFCKLILKAETFEGHKDTADVGITWTLDGFVPWNTNPRPTHAKIQDFGGPLLVPMFDKTSTPPSPPNGKGRIISKDVKVLSRVKQRYHLCHDHGSAHYDCKPESIWNERPTSSEVGLSVFRLVDIAKNRIKRFHPGNETYHPYAALRYSIGIGKTTPVIDHDYMHDVLQEQDGLDTLHLPKTYRDVMKVVLKLGLNYLWVDGLRLVVGSDKKKGIANMDRVYEGAAVTIIEADGDIDHGIDCLHRDHSSDPQPNGRHLRNGPSPMGDWGYIQGVNAHLHDSSYVTRGWT
jgi:hypothetical protein